MNNMEIPKFHETFNPILEILSDRKTIHSRELINQVVAKYYSHLPRLQSIDFLQAHLILLG